MIDHVSIGVRDVAKAKRFYDAALKPLGYACLSEGEGSLGYGRDAVALWIGAAERPVPADEKSGLHLCFAAPTRKERRRLPRRGAEERRARQRQARASRRLRPELLCGVRRRSRRLPHRGPLRARRGLTRMPR